MSSKAPENFFPLINENNRPSSNFVLNYRIVGNGPPLLLVHGFGISFNIWNSIAPFLSPHFTLIMIELPGIGNSPIPEKGKSYRDQAADGIETIRNLLGIEQWKVLSYSSSTRVAERIYSIVCFACRARSISVCRTIPYVKNFEFIFGIKI